MVYFGIVEDIDDPLQMGRVRVRVQPFYSDFAIKDLPWAFIERSTDFGPIGKLGWNQHNLRKGSQVTVEFLDDKMQQPLVRGVVPKLSDMANNPSFVNRTLTFYNGTKITIDETIGQERISVEDTIGNYIVLNQEGITINGSKLLKNVTINAGKDIEEEAQANISAKSGMNISLNANANINLDAKANVNIKANANVNLESTGNTNIKSTGITTVDASSLKLKNITGPNKLCSLPACLFTGTLHQAPTTGD